MSILAPYELVLRSIVKSDTHKFIRRGDGNVGYLSCISNVDGEYWEAFAPGYPHELFLKKKYKIKGIIGAFEKENGKHKIAVRLYAPGFDIKVASEQIDVLKKMYRKGKNKGVWKLRT